MDEPAIVAEGLVKTFGTLRALDGVSFVAPEGQVLGLLGPNGAGKTTAIRILSTLLAPDGGRAAVGGFDVVRHPRDVRRLIGLTGQYAAVDELLSGEENLYMIGRLLGFHVRDARARAKELLTSFDLSDAAAKAVKTYSGGMRRRLDLAASLVGRPRFLYLDEPTTGLDPRSRHQLWDLIKELVASGTTVLLTTQYLDEADHLADGIVVVDHGRVIAQGTSDELKAKVGGQVVEVQPADHGDVQQIVRLLEELSGSESQVDSSDGMVTVPVAEPGVLGQAMARLNDSGVAISHMALRRASLDEVFLALTGHPAEEEPAEGGGDQDRTAELERAGR
ncbi:MAG: oleandomycin transport system ATP-binding protein [Actinomycetota bacterium]|jgi:oleandomycin transport system ATP-binding protein|nr:oleandomycin transport system ATP-binding protein [Actinomycetota bacterium]